MPEEKEFIGTILSIKQETPDVKTFRISKQKDFQFISGQYCLVSFVDNEKFGLGERPFTFSNTSSKDFIELTIKQMRNFTVELFKLKVGDKLKIKGPFISSMRYVIENKLKNKIILIYSNRTQGDIIHQGELNNINKKFSNMAVVNTLTNEIPGDWEGEKGFINKEMIQKYVKNTEKWLWYICGPPPMIDAMKKLLIDMGIGEGKMRIEGWQILGKHD